MKHTFLLLFLSCVSSIFAQNKVFVYGSTSLNFTNRNLEPIGEKNETWKLYFKKRRREEFLAIRESLNLGLGLNLNDQFSIRLGVDYKRLGDRERVEILTLQPSGIYDLENYRAIHSYSYIGIPLALQFRVWNCNKKLETELSYAANFRLLFSNSNSLIVM